MRRTSIGELSLGLLFTVGILILYKFWLTYPILRILTIVQWKIVAVLVAAVLGIASGMAGLHAHLVVGATMVGLVLGGAWAGLSAPNDVPTTFLDQFVGHLKAFWPEVVLFTTVPMATNLVCTYLFQKERKPI